MEKDMEEQELLEGYRKLRPELKDFIMELVITAVTTERQYGLPLDNTLIQSMSSQFSNRERDGGILQSY